MATGGIGATTTEGLNLQARFEQLEGAISEAHEIVAQMMPHPDEAKEVSPPVAPDATSTATRCSESLANLIGRLQSLHDRVGLVV